MKRPPLLFIITLWALLIRLIGIDYGLPYFGLKDESFVFMPAVSIIRHADLNPHFFKYPSFIFYIYSFFFLIYIGLKSLLSTFLGHHQTIGSLIDNLPFYLNELFLYGRIITAIFGTATVYALYITVATVFSPRMAVFASLFLLLSPTHIAFSKMIKPDTIQVFFITLLLFYSMKYFKEGDKKYIYWSALYAGISTGIKYNFFPTVIVMASFYFRLRNKNMFTWSRFIKNGGLILLISCFAFVISSPYLIIDFSNAMTGILQEYMTQQNPLILKIQSGTRGYGILGHLIFQMGVLFPYMFGFSPYILFLIGIPKLWRINRQKLVLVLSFPLIHIFIFAAFSNWGVPQHYLPLIPFSSMIAACGIIYILKIKTKILKLMIICSTFFDIGYYSTGSLTFTEMCETLDKKIHDRYDNSSIILTNYYGQIPIKITKYKYLAYNTQQLISYFDNNSEYPDVIVEWAAATNKEEGRRFYTLIRGKGYGLKEIIDPFFPYRKFYEILGPEFLYLNKILIYEKTRGIF